MVFVSDGVVGRLAIQKSPTKVCIPVKCAMFLTSIKVHILLFEDVMQSHLLRMHEFCTLDIQHCFAKTFQTIIAIHHTFVQLPFRGFGINKHQRHLLQYVLLIIPYFSGGTFIDFVLPPQCAFGLLGAFGLLNFAMISHRWVLVKWVASSFIHFLL